MRFFIGTPPGAVKPPNLSPVDDTTRWQGTTIGKQLPDMTLPTALAARGDPAAAASWP